MIRSALARLHQGHRTNRVPAGPTPALPERFRGRPVIDVSRCPDGCRACADACPTEAITAGPSPRVDLGRCLFCTDCADACPEGAVTFAREFRLAATDRQGLVVSAPPPIAGSAPAPSERAQLEASELVPRVEALDAAMRRLFGRSLQLRQVSAGGCNACEVEAAVLQTIVFDMGRFGIQFVASPRHADGLLVTGPVTRNMSDALKKTWEALPPPRIVIASGACAISGGPYLGHPECQDGASSELEVDLFVPGCPPHPLTLLDGLLRLLGKM